MGERVERKTVAIAVSDERPEDSKEERAQGSAKSATVEERKAEKKQIRLAALAKRDSLTPGQRGDYSSRIIKKLTSLPCYENADAVLVYAGFRSEVDTFSLLEQAFADGKAVFAPKVIGKEMAFYRIFSPDDLAAGYRGIMEPAGGQLFEAWIADWGSQCRKRPPETPLNAVETAECRDMAPSALVCMPGAAFDRACHRIGYGGGFYDRYLGRFLQDSACMDAASYIQVRITTAALAYDCQIFEEIPWEAHDICPMCVVTEKGILGNGCG